MAVSSVCWPNWAPSTSGLSKLNLCDDPLVCVVCVCVTTLTLCCVNQISEGPNVVGDG